MNTQKRLYRSTKDRMLAGVCGGIAEYLDVDPTLVRLVFVALTFLGGPGIVIYIALMLIVPENPGYESGYSEKPKRAADIVSEEAGNYSVRSSIPVPDDEPDTGEPQI